MLSAEAQGHWCQDHSRRRRRTYDIYQTTRIISCSPMNFSMLSIEPVKADVSRFHNRRAEHAKQARIIREGPYKPSGTFTYSFKICEFLVQPCITK